jgi:hypothetical protein
MPSGLPGCVLSRHYAGVFVRKNAASRKSFHRANYRKTLAVLNEKASTTPVIEGRLRFLTLIQCGGVRPDRRVELLRQTPSRPSLGILIARKNAPTIERDRKACERNADRSANYFSHRIYHARVAIRRQQLQ